MRRLARCVMVQGSASDVGKSVIATALCRVLTEEGYRVAPFKAQNMSLNAAATRGGGEIGRAQAAQAEAAGVLPHVDMNPILLKPEGDTRSQVVVLGKVHATVTAREYWSTRSRLWPTVAGALRRLRETYDVVVIEGAGSPAEINLRSDLANMRVARAADARVLLVGDIERGGVFAQLLGTLDLLRPTDRARVRGLLVNKFRGDASLFTSGARLLARRSGVPVLGVLPYARDLGVAAEDVLAIRDGASPTPGWVDVAVVSFPHISNFDDLEPLAAGGASVRYVARPEHIGTPDLLILPGSKTTIKDLQWVRHTGIGARIDALAKAGVPILGLCGGFQMLGLTLADPNGVEGVAGRVPGLGLLPVQTTFTRTKRTVRVTGTARGWLGAASSHPLSGYEIHLGETRRRGVEAYARLRREDGGTVTDGAMSGDGLVVGTYVHGLFANAGLRDQLLGELSRRRGIAFTPMVPADPYARVATWFRAAVPVRRLLTAVDLG